MDSFGSHIDRVSAFKTLTSCGENKFWQVLKYFVGRANLTLDAYYGDVGKIHSLPNDAQNLILNAEEEVDKLLKDEEVNKAITANQPPDSPALTPLS